MWCAFRKRKAAVLDRESEPGSEQDEEGEDSGVIESDDIDALMAEGGEDDEELATALRRRALEDGEGDEDAEDEDGGSGGSEGGSGDGSDGGEEDEEGGGGEGGGSDDDGGEPKAADSDGGEYDSDTGSFHSEDYEVEAGGKLVRKPGQAASKAPGQKGAGTKPTKDGGKGGKVQGEGGTMSRRQQKAEERRAKAKDPLLNKNNNRLGQKARRALYERMFGRDANHVKTLVSRSCGSCAPKGEPLFFLLFFFFFFVVVHPLWLPCCLVSGWFMFAYH